MLISIVNALGVRRCQLLLSCVMKAKCQTWIYIRDRNLTFKHENSLFLTNFGSGKSISWFIVIGTWTILDDFLIDLPNAPENYGFGLELASNVSQSCQMSSAIHNIFHGTRHWQINMLFWHMHFKQSTELSECMWAGIFDCVPHTFPPNLKPWHISDGEIWRGAELTYWTFQ